MGLIDAFLRTNTKLNDVGKVLHGFDCQRVMVRNAGLPTELWQRTADGWRRDRPQMTLFDDLCPKAVELSAFRTAPGGAVIEFVGDDPMALRFNEVEAAEWLAAMEPHRYAVEDAIGCTGGIEGCEALCAIATFPLADFKSMTVPKTQLGQRVVKWIDRVHAAGADQVGATISIGEHLQP